MIFEWRMAADAARNALAADPRPKAIAEAEHLNGGDALLEIQDPQSLARTSELMLPRPVRLAAFSEDGSRLVTVTSDQVVRVFDVPALKEEAHPAARSASTLPIGDGTRL